MDLREIVELCLCEQDTIVLKPDTAYIFRVDEKCEACMKLYDVYFKDVQEKMLKEKIDEALSEWRTTDELSAILEIDKDSMIKDVFSKRSMEYKTICREKQDGKAQNVHHGDEDGDQKERSFFDENKVFEGEFNDILGKVFFGRMPNFPTLGDQHLRGDCLHKEKSECCDHEDKQPDN